MLDTLIYKSSPIGSLVTRSPEEEARYVERLLALPPGLIDVVMSPKTGAYVRGLVRTHHLSEEAAPQVAFTVLRVATGVIRLNQLAAELAERLSIDQNAAEKLALEIERDLFAPVALELNQYLKEVEKEGKNWIPDQVRDDKGGAGSRVPGSSPGQALPGMTETAKKRPETQGMKNVLDLKDRPKPPPVPPSPPAGGAAPK